MSSFPAGDRNSADNQDRDMQEKIVSLMQSIPHAPRKQLGEAERYKLKLKAADSRPAQMLKPAVEAERQPLLSAADRLDRSLSDISTAKDVTAERKSSQK